MAMAKRKRPARGVEAPPAELREIERRMAAGCVVWTLVRLAGRRRLVCPIEEAARHTGRLVAWCVEGDRVWKEV